MIASVIVDIIHSNIDKVFDYEIGDLQVLQGSRVLVPFANKKIEGFVLHIKEKSDYPKALKKIEKVLDVIPPITTESLALCDYLCSQKHFLNAEVLRLFLPHEVRKTNEKKHFVVSLCKNCDLTQIRKNSTRELKIVEELKTQEFLPTTHFEGCQSALKSLQKKNIIEISSQKTDRIPYKHISNFDKEIQLTQDQQNAVLQIESTQKPTLLFGVTGSGKTEVYVELIKHNIKNGKNAMLLVPEIALTPQMLSRFRTIFGEKVAVFHSALSSGERFDEWWKIREGKAKLVIGTKSAVFAPIQNLGIVIIDEEHEHTYQSDTSPRYDTIEVAKFRANYNNAKLLLASATPLVETYQKTVSGEMQLVKLEKRINEKPLPQVELVDLRREKRKGNNSVFSRTLLSQMEDVLAKGEQVLLFLNRRGYSPSIICADCGYVAKCPNCEVPLVFHSEENLLKCHYCGAKFKMLDFCPECDSQNIRNVGVGTQKVVAELKNLFPNAKILRMDNDTTRQKESHHKIAQDFSEHKADILVGTQMIAKGHNFPLVTLVGVLDADMSLYTNDYRSVERTFSLITQVAGRAGRAEFAGKVVVQTYTPHHFVYKYICNYDYEGFFKNEIALREACHFPPFCEIIKILFSSQDEDSVLQELKGIFEKLQQLKEEFPQKFYFLGKMKSPIKKIAQKFRYQIIMRVANDPVLLEKIFDIATQDREQNIYFAIQNPQNLT